MSGAAPSVVIVAGGESRRLGRAKPFVRIGGRAVLLRLLEATAHLPDRVLSVGSPAPFRRALAGEGWTRAAPPEESPRERIGDVWEDAQGRRRLRLVPDPEPGMGPLTGLAAGLGAARGDVCVALAGDLPFVTRALVDALGAALGDDPERDAAVPRVGGRAQPLCAAYRRRARAEAARLAAGGGHAASMMGLLERLSVRYLEPEELAAASDLSAASDVAALTRGIDRPGDVEWARRRARARRRGRGEA